MQSIATTVSAGAFTSGITSAIYEKALDVTETVVGDMTEATRSGQAKDIVATTQKVFGEVSRYLTASTNEPNHILNAMARKLVVHANKFCDALTRDSIPNVAAFSSASHDFTFNCQKSE